MTLGIDFLNEKGLELVQLKKALNTNNELIRIPLKESVKAMTLKASLKLALTDDTTVSQFIDLLLKEKTCVNQEKVYNVYGQYTEALEVALRKRNIPVQFDISVKEGVVVVKRYGATADYAKTHFKMKDKEFDALQESGFVDTYMRTLALAMKRDIEEKIKQFQKKGKFSAEGNLQTKVSNVYYDEETGYYNVDVRILLLDYKNLDRDHSESTVVDGIEIIIESLQGAYFKRMY